MKYVIMGRQKERKYEEWDVQKVLEQEKKDNVPVHFTAVLLALDGILKLWLVMERTSLMIGLLIKILK